MANVVAASPACWPFDGIRSAFGELWPVVVLHFASGLTLGGTIDVQRRLMGDVGTPVPY
jgi:hypothetical protein